MYIQSLQEKLNEALKAVLPIVGIVIVLSLTIAPMPNDVLLSFLFGGILLIAGMMFFSVGAELSMEKIGESIGASLTKTKKIWLILLISSALGMVITISEPDLQVLAKQVASIPDSVLILSVAAGVGLFLAVAVLRMLFGISFNALLIILYSLVFLLAFLAPKEFLSVAFDSGGVTTGPMTVPFIMAYGIGICAVRTDRKAAEDSFGLISLCSVGPILSVLILSILYRAGDASYASPVPPDVSLSNELGKLFAVEFPVYLKEISAALLPIILFFGIFQVAALRLKKKALLRIITGLIYTFVGLVIFLTGVNVGFMPAGAYLGMELASLPYRWVIIPIGMIIGYFIVKAEPAVYVLMKQVEELTNGTVTGKALQFSLSLGVAASVGLALARVLYGIPILLVIGPGYLLALGMTFFVPKIFTAIAFDSGGVASGPMTATFLLPFAVGACLEAGGNVVTDAFGVVALVAMTPLIAIQILGIVYRIRISRKAETVNEVTGFDDFDNYTVIDL